MKKNILIPIEYKDITTVIDELGNEIEQEVTKVRYEPQNVEMTPEEIAEFNQQYSDIEVSQ